MKPYDKKWKQVLATSVFVFTGNALLAFLVAAFIIPHGIVMGGTTGIGIVLGNVFHMDTSLFILALNVILLFTGLIFLGKKLFMTTVASSLLYPLLLAAIQRIPGIGTMTDDHLLAALFGGVLMGIALGLVLRVGASTGGTDIVCLLLQKKTHLPLSLLVNLTDALI
ncbi:MAG: YitT family protein, partial [Parasporobacterium sp.]|nr:YitT family protein [Parasporobacterium sp.]